MKPIGQPGGLPNRLRLVRIAAGWLALQTLAGEGPQPPRIAPDASIQSALDANPGRMVFVAAGDYFLNQAIVIRAAGSGLYGYGRLIQANTNAAVIEVRGASEVRLRDLTLTRPEGQGAARAPAISARDCTNLSLVNLRVLDNCAPASAITLRQCVDAEVIGCRVENYSTIAVDDRTQSPHYGYAFNCIDGTGIGAGACPGLLLQANRVVERRIRPTPELKARHKLGEFVKRAVAKGFLVSQPTWDAGYVNNWHQGSALAVTGPEESRFVRVLDNYIENAAQGIDLHSDNVVVSGNLVVNSFIGLKAMHGSRNVAIANNQFVRNDLWAIGLMPGAASHAAIPATNRAPARPANTDGGHLVANNIISEFGHGDAAWIWGAGDFTRAPLVFDRGQEADDPPLREVLVTGNLVERTATADGSVTLAAPRLSPPFRYCVFIAEGPTSPRGLRFYGNLFPAGREGVANRTLEP